MLEVGKAAGRPELRIHRLGLLCIEGVAGGHRENRQHVADAFDRQVPHVAEDDRDVRRLLEVDPLHHQRGPCEGLRREPRHRVPSGSGPRVLRGENHQHDVRVLEKGLEDRGVTAVPGIGAGAIEQVEIPQELRSPPAFQKQRLHRMIAFAAVAVNANLRGQRHGSGRAKFFADQRVEQRGFPRIHLADHRDQHGLGKHRLRMVRLGFETDLVGKTADPAQQFRQAVANREVAFAGHREFRAGTPFTGRKRPVPVPSGYPSRAVVTLLRT